MAVEIFRDGPCWRNLAAGTGLVGCGVARWIVTVVTALLIATAGSSMAQSSAITATGHRVALVG